MTHDCHAHLDQHRRCTLCGWTLLWAERTPRGDDTRDGEKAMDLHTPTRKAAKELEQGGMRCNCDLDNWEPDRRTGHSWVCRIHKAAIRLVPPARWHAGN